MYYTYVHRRASDNLIFYVGKGTGKRAWSHKGRSLHWHNVVKKHGICVEIWNTFTDETEAFQNEIDLIAKMKGWMPLTNKTYGGEGVSGYRYSPDQIERCRVQNTGENNPYFGKKHSQELKQKMRELRQGVLNPMFGKSGKLSPTAKTTKVEFDNGKILVFDTAREAANFTGINESDMPRYIKQIRKIPKKYKIKSIQHVNP